MAFCLLGMAKAPGVVDLGGISSLWKYRGRRLFVWARPLMVDGNGGETPNFVMAEVPRAIAQWCAILVYECGKVRAAAHCVSSGWAGGSNFVSSGWAGAGGGRRSGLWACGSSW